MNERGREMTGHRNTWYNIYALWVDGRKTDIELIGASKTKAYEMLPDQWYAHRRGERPPPKSRCKLVYIESTRDC